MISIGARSGPRRRSLELRSPARMLGPSPGPGHFWRSARFPRPPACTEVAAATERALNARWREGCGEPIVLSVGLGIGRAQACQIRATSPLSLLQITRHTMQSNFTRKSLKTNDGHPKEVTHKSGVQCPGFSAVWIRRRPEFSPFDFPISRARAVFRFSNFDFRFSKPISESRRLRPASDSLSGGTI